jgi:hypothetical protein
MQEILLRAAARGEIHPTALTPRVIETGPVLLVHHYLVGGAPIPAPVITQIVDEVVLPLLGLGRSQPFERETRLDPLAGLDREG